MKIGVLVLRADGMQSPLSDRLSGSPHLVVFDTADGSLVVAEEWHGREPRAMCEPVAQLLARQVEVVLARGMSLHGIQMLAAKGITARITAAATAGAAIAEFTASARDRETPC